MFNLLKMIHMSLYVGSGITFKFCKNKGVNLGSTGFRARVGSESVGCVVTQRYLNRGKDP